MTDDLDAFFRAQIARVQRVLNPPALNRDDDFTEMDSLAQLQVHATGNTRGHMGPRHPSADAHVGHGRILPGLYAAHESRRGYLDYVHLTATGDTSTGDA